MGIYVGNKRYALFVGSTRRKAVVPSSLTYDAELMYLESTGAQYINLPLTANSGQYFAIEGDMINVRTYNGSQFPVFSANPANQFKGDFYSYTTTTTYGSTIGGSSTSGGWGNGKPAGTMGFFHLGTDGRTASSNGVYSALSRPLTANITAFRLFGGYDSNNCSVAFGKVKIIIGDTVKYDLTPVRIGQVGYMYDKVSGTLFGNAGTGDFILGNDKN